MTPIRAVAIAFVAVMLAVLAASTWILVTAPPTPATLNVSHLTCAHYTAIGQSYKCGRA